MRQTASQPSIQDLRTVVELIAYEVEHVPMVHSWLLENAQLAALVGTEQLPTLKEEYENQAGLSGRRETHWKRLISVRQGHSQNIVGDIDCFFGDSDASESRITCEINILIADAQWRSRGIGKRAMCLAMEELRTLYGSKSLQFVAKIDASNKASLDFFRSLHFHPTSKVPNVFNEFTFIRGS
jgi:RimJ/RimL family protein N-acetyltransferase